MAVSQPDRALYENKGANMSNSSTKKRNAKPIKPTSPEESDGHRPGKHAINWASTNQSPARLLLIVLS